MRALTKIVTLGSIVCAAAVSTACVGGSSDVSKEDQDRLKAFVLDKPPASVPHKLNINYDGKVTLVGYSIEPSGPVSAGQRVALTMYWRSDKKLDEGWNLFTHIVDGSGERILNIDNVGPLREWRENRQALWPSAWEAGKYYVDQQVFTLPAGVKTDKVQVVVGVWKDNDRLKPISGPHDSEKRGIVATIPTTATAAAEGPVSTRVPNLRVDKLARGVQIKIDGKLDEPAWATTPASSFVDVSSGRANPTAPISGQVKVLWNDEGLLVGFEVKDSDVRGGFKKEDKDPHLWTKDTVEIMIDPDGDGDNQNYYELQINPQNLVFDSQFDAYNQPKKDPNGPFGHQEWSAKLKSAVTIQGTLDEASDKDQGYVVEALLPWKSFTKAKKVPPAVGDTWRMNFYAMQDNGGVAWSPILGQGNFHKATRFGRVQWAEAGWLPPELKPPTGTLGGDAGAAASGDAGAAVSAGARFTLPKMPRIKIPGTPGPKVQGAPPAASAP
ncbi:MAG TPA: carbohydrate-binding family 9-like protein [Polyangiaceae bacterium]|nr:carbohydrate-binding family 9-like protein [Polyangiaceae bacterium]